MAERSKALV